MIKGKPGRSLSKKEYEIVSELALRGIDIISIDDASKLFKTKKKKLWDILHRLEKKGWLERIEKGKYMVVPLQAKEGWLEHPFVLASNLVEKYYISYRTALAHHGLTEQLPLYVYVATTKRKGKTEYELQNYIFRFVRIKQEKFFGFRSESIGGQKIFIAEKEKAIVDCLDKERYSGSVIEIAKALTNVEISINKVKKYALKMNNSSLVRRLGYLLDLLKKDSSGLEKHIGKYRNIYLSTALPRRAVETSKKWRLIVNVKKEDLLAW
ncbi:MAG: type IV toxin-antitoxin system AbiEi family antitoxin domain-containing protein [Candidatus Altiarchaeota archaeon]|nr:type IV toxin-antitoxin system AbiEi family antitoxin domain-containing protein [Candidatus Altiarchaeota archaeon]